MRGSRAPKQRHRGKDDRPPWGALSVLIAYWVILFTATHWPHPPDLAAVAGSDKTAHLAGYAVLTFLLARAVAPRHRRLSLTSYGAIIAAMAAYGIVDELLQPFVGRYAECGDWAADVAGALVGSLCFRLWEHIRLG
jgi:VanZ family protein